MSKNMNYSKTFHSDYPNIVISYIKFLSILPLFLFQAIPLYIHWINKEYIPQIDIHPIFKCNFCSFLAKIELESYNYMFFA